MNSQFISTIIPKKFLIFKNKVKKLKSDEVERVIIKSLYFITLFINVIVY